MQCNPGEREFTNAMPFALERSRGPGRLGPGFSESKHKPQHANALYQQPTLPDSSGQQDENQIAAPQLMP